MACPNCGFEHETTGCPSFVAFPADNTNAPSSPPWTLNRPADLRAAEALERCADALDRIAKTLEEG